MTRKTAHSKKALLEALEKSLGVVTTACKLADVPRRSYYEYYEDDEQFRAAVDELANVALDFGESALHKQIQAGEVASTIFFLKTKGKKRGYVERQEHTGADGKDLNNPDAALTDAERAAKARAFLADYERFNPQGK